MIVEEGAEEDKRVDLVDRKRGTERVRELLVGIFEAEDDFVGERDRSTVDFLLRRVRGRAEGGGEVPELGNPWTEDLC